MKAVLSIILLFSVLFTCTAFAAVNPSELQKLQRQQDQILRQQEERLRQQEEDLRRNTRPAPSVTQPELLPHVQDAPGAACMEVKTITVTGVSLLSKRELNAITSTYLNRCLTLADMNNLLRDLTNAYIEKGYVTARAFLAPEQQLLGDLSVLVIEGTVEKVVINDGDKNYYYRMRTAFPGLTGKPLNLRDIEQGLDQLNRMPSGNATMELEPGAGLGGTIVKITMPQERSWRAGAGMDNLGQSSTGETQYSLSLSKDNAFGLGDQFSIYWTQDVPVWGHEMFREHRKKHGHNDSLSFYASVPWGYWTFSANASKSRYKTDIIGNFYTYTSRGDTEAYSVQVDRVIHRNADSKTSLGLSLHTRNVNSWVQGFHIDSSSYHFSTVQASLSHSTKFLDGMGSLSFTYTRGLPWFESKKALSPSAPHTDFDKYSIYASWYKPFTVLNQNFSWSTSVNAQYSPQTLYGPERIQIGGKSTVRGFNADSLAGDTGAYLRNELALSTPYPSSLQTKALYGLQLYAAYDYGFLHKDTRDSFERGEMHGATLGIRTLGAFNLDISLSKALRAPNFIKYRDTEFYATLNYTF